LIGRLAKPNPAKTRKVETSYDPNAGVGSQGYLYFVGLTILKDPNKDLRWMAVTQFTYPIEIEIDEAAAMW